MVRVVFLHPDLGIGGAERAVIDAALALKTRSHDVQFVTAHHDATHCFEETRDGTLEVVCAGDWLPRNLFGRCFALCAYLRMIYIAIYLVVFSRIQFDVVFCDQISVCIPILKLSRAKIMFYCHFPDMLLTTRRTFLKKIYRAPIDWAEEKTTGMADCVLVNSKFTSGIFRDTFKSLSDIHPQVLYPTPDFGSFKQPVLPPTKQLMPTDKDLVFLSINRFERKKNLGLALQSFAKIKGHFPDLKYVHLIVAGGYDNRVKENIEYFRELNDLAVQLNIADDVTFLKSFTDSEKRTLLKYSSCLLYTPENEHFGIVPIEAMYMQCPVIAVNSGGPLETVEHGVTGFLCKSNAVSFSEHMEKFLVDRNLRSIMGLAGKSRVLSKFSFKKFSDTLNTILINLTT